MAEKKGFVGQFMFSVPSLPPEWYKRVRGWMEAQELSAWQTVIAGLWALSHIEATDPASFKNLLDAVRKGYAAHPAKKPQA